MQLNTDQYNSIRLNTAQSKLNEAHWSSQTLNDTQRQIIEYAYVLYSASSTMNPKISLKFNENLWNSTKNSAKLNEAHWSSMQVKEAQ